MTTTTAPGPGDLARRIVHRRMALGLTREALARDAGVDETFLAYLEEHADVQLGRRTLATLARVLQTSPEELLGGDRDRPPGHGDAHPGAILEAMTPIQCRHHLEAGGVGRVIFNTPRGPVALPVNFRFSDGEVLIQTTLAHARELESQDRIGFEIDRIDDAVSEGWSVMVTGFAHQVDDPERLVEHAAAGLSPWAGGYRPALVAIAVDEITGRVIVHDRLSHS
jgi:hypothetical protein